MSRTLGRLTAIARLPAYRPRRPPTRVDLSDNTSLWGPPPSVRATLAGLTDDQLSRYPSPYADALCEALAARHAVEVDQVVTGCGSDDVLDSAMRALADAGGTLAVATPTFSIIPTFAALNELRLVAVPLGRDGAADVGGLLDAGPDLVYLCSPNNPTGTRVGDEALATLLDGTDATVLLDEAYADFADGDALSLLAAHPNLVSVRTLSKAHGLAGLRVGYAVGSPGRIGAVAASRGPYKVSSVAEAVALGVLRDDAGWVEERAAEVKALRGWFTAALRDAGHEVLESEANFVALLVDDATRELERLLAAGVLARAYPRLEVFGDLLRVTIGPRPQLEEALALLAGGER